MIISRTVLLRLKNVSDESFRENQNTRFMFSDPPPKILLKTAHCYVSMATLYVLGGYKCRCTVPRKHTGQFPWQHFYISRTLSLRTHWRQRHKYE